MHFTVNNEKSLTFSCYQHRSKIHRKTIGFLSQNDTIYLYICLTWNILYLGERYEILNLWIDLFDREIYAVDYPNRKSKNIYLLFYTSETYS